ncbi:MAG: 50S ribosomal protein L29 [Gemmatimonadetes bacterium]|nr:50S ribosomal protein L29 [Gemmatimonadota bacterium]
MSGAKARNADAPTLRELSTEEVQARIESNEREIFNLRFRSATMELENPMQLRHLRRDIARMKTVLRERELAAEDVQ